jgi:sacsin
VLQGGDWTEALTSALQKLGCCLLGTQLLSQQLHCPALAPFVQQPTAAGVLDALAAVDAAAAAAAASIGRSNSSRGLQQLLLLQQSEVRSLQQLLQTLTAAERHHLRTYLLQRKWFRAAAMAAAGSAAATAATGAAAATTAAVASAGGDAAATATAQLVTRDQLQLLRLLPIYEVHPALPYEDTKALQQQQQTANDHVADSTAAAGAECATHCALAQAGRPPLLLAPHGISSSVLGSRFLRCESAAEEELLQQHLGVQRLSMSVFLAQHLAAAPQQLEQRGLVASVVYVLQHLQQLAQEDPSLPSVLG